jgi:glycosyltransferase involved in cell wall biosynthesis
VARKKIHKYEAKIFGTVPENQMILQKEYGFLEDRILYSPIGTDLSIFRFDPASRADLRRDEKLQDRDTVLLFTGKLNYRKNPHLILEALKLIDEKINQPLHVYFLGAADQIYKEKEMGITFTNENIRIKFVPAVPVAALFRWYSMADFAVFPSENTLSALDAQACRLPVIMESDITNQERLADGGLTYEKGDMKDLSEKILILMIQKEQRRNLGNKGEIYVRTKYDYRQIVKDMESDLGLFKA